MTDPRRIGVIDCGSNSFRLVVFAAGPGWWKRTDEIYEAVRIGEGLAATGKLGEAPMGRALATLDVFSHFARASALPPVQLLPVATSAIRDATNARPFLKRVRKATGLDVRVLSREEEAHYGYLAAVNSTTLADGCVLDLGGGSMQLVQVASRFATASASWPLGAVRMTERFLPGKEPAKRKQLDALREHVAGELKSASWLKQGGERLVGIGGTVRNLAAAVQHASGLPSMGVQGQVITREALDDLIETLAELPPAKRASVRGIKPGRADLILAGAVVVRTVLEAGRFEALMATEAGLREGVFFEQLLQGQDDPLFDDVRRSSVLNLAAQYGGDDAHTQHVAELALGFFDQLAGQGLHPGDPIERELLWAASCLHDIGMSIDYDDHHKHSRYLILNAGLPGYTPTEVAVIAQAARYHRKGMPSPGPLAPLLLAKRDIRRLERCAVLLRLAEDLERSRDQSVTAAHIDPGEDGEVHLHLVGEGDSAVPRWAAGREIEAFARAFDRRLVVTRPTTAA